jgi:hypothetical protein
MTMNAVRSFCLLLLFPLILPAADERLNSLTTKEIEDGWLLIFDGETTFGWSAESTNKKERAETEIKEGVLNLIGEQTQLQFNTRFPAFELSFEYRASAGPGGSLSVTLGDEKVKPFAIPLRGFRDEWAQANLVCEGTGISYQVKAPSGESQMTNNSELNRGPYRIRFQAGKDQKVAGELFLRNVKLKPLGPKSIFNGKDLTGWKVFPGEKYKSTYSVTSEGWLNVKNGPGDLQTEAKYDSFVLQLECLSNGKALNSGIFFRCIEGEYQNGYEMQIQNGFNNDDRSKPADFGTGAIYRRIAARKVVPNDKEWFGLTLVADGKQLSTWANGIQVVDWNDPRPEDNNPRKGSKTGKGHISIQGHDVTTDLSFRKLRICEFGP